jgi:hypothetical protein
MFGSVGVLHALLGVPRHGTAVLWGATSCRNAAPLHSLTHSVSRLVGWSLCSSR